MCSPGGSVRLYAALHREGEVGTWACQHVEDQRCAGCAPRRWITEVGFEGRDLDSGTVSIITMYSDLPGFMGPLQPAPRPNIPLLMEKLLENDMLSCTVEGLPLALHPIEFGPAGADRLRNFLALPHRETPVIVVAPTRSGELPIDPEAISRSWGPTRSSASRGTPRRWTPSTGRSSPTSSSAAPAACAYTPLSRTSTCRATGSTTGSSRPRPLGRTVAPAAWRSCAAPWPKTCTRATRPSAWRTSSASPAGRAGSVRAGAARRRSRTWP